MVNQNFSEYVIFNGDRYHLLPDNFQDTSLRFIAANGNRIPFISCFGVGSVLRVSQRVAIFNRIVDTEMLLKLFIEGSNICFVPVRRRSYYVGKGVLLDNNLQVLAMLTVSRQFYDQYQKYGELCPEHIQEHFTLVISNVFMSAPEHRTVYSKFRKEYRKHTFGLHFTPCPERESFVQFSLPAFTTIDERREFLRDFTVSTVRNGLTL